MTPNVIKALIALGYTCTKLQYENELLYRISWEDVKNAENT